MLYHKDIMWDNKWELNKIEYKIVKKISYFYVNIFRDIYMKCYIIKILCYILVPYVVITSLMFVHF